MLWLWFKLRWGWRLGGLINLSTYYISKVAARLCFLGTPLEVCSELEKHLTLDKSFVPFLQVTRCIPHILKQITQLLVSDPVCVPVRSFGLPVWVNDLNVKQNFEAVLFQKRLSKIKLPHGQTRNLLQKFDCMPKHKAYTLFLLRSNLKLKIRKPFKQMDQCFKGSLDDLGCFGLVFDQV